MILTFFLASRIFLSAGAMDFLGGMLGVKIILRSAPRDTAAMIPLSAVSRWRPMYTDPSSYLVSARVG